jgi:hypothetical protein
MEKRGAALLADYSSQSSSSDEKIAAVMQIPHGTRRLVMDDITVHTIVIGAYAHIHQASYTSYAPPRALHKHTNTHTPLRPPRNSQKKLNHRTIVCTPTCCARAIFLVSCLVLTLGDCDLAGPCEPPGRRGDATLSLTAQYSETSQSTGGGAYPAGGPSAAGRTRPSAAVIPKYATCHCCSPTAAWLCGSCLSVCISVACLPR